MFKKITAASFVLSTLSACGGSGGGTSGAGQIDYDSPTVVEELQAQIALIDSTVNVSAGGDGSLILAKGSDTITIRPGNTTATTIELSGTMYGVVIDPSGKYTYSPVTNTRSVISYQSAAQSLMSDIKIVNETIGSDPGSNYVDLTLGTKNASASAAPDIVKLGGSGSAEIGGQFDGIVVAGNISVEQNMEISHNFVDQSVRAAHEAGWDGTGVNVTVRDWDFDPDTYQIEQSFDGQITYSDGDQTTTETVIDTSAVNLYITHGDLVNGLATGLDWRDTLEEYYGIFFDDGCSGSTGGSQTLDGLTATTQVSISSNHCGKIGVATGANSSFVSVSDVGWGELVKVKNESNVIEILNFSFGSGNDFDLSFDDNHNVVIVNSAGNESEENNGYDIYADGRSPSSSIDLDETMELTLTESNFADNLIAVGALDADDTIAVYSTIAGPDYDGTTYAFLVDDGTVNLDFSATTSLDGRITLNDGSSKMEADFDGTLYETLEISTQGTSYAAPRVTGKMAIASHKFPNLNAEQLVNLAKHTAIDLGAEGIDEIYGHGKINLTGMLSPIGRLR